MYDFTINATECKQMKFLKYIRLSHTAAAAAYRLTGMKSILISSYDPPMWVMFHFIIRH